MKPTHVIQLVCAAVIACGGAALPLLVTPMTPTAWLGLAIAEAAALKTVLGVQSEVAGDKGAPADQLAKIRAAEKTAS
jgi:hypothetical protein